MIDLAALLADAAPVNSRGYTADRIYPSRADPENEPVRATAARAIEDFLDSDMKWHSTAELTAIARRHKTDLKNALQAANIAEDDYGRWYCSPFCRELESPAERTRRLTPKRRRTA